VRNVHVDIVTENVKKMCIEANYYLSEDMKKVFNQAVEDEKSPLGKQILNH